MLPVKKLAFGWHHLASLYIFQQKHSTKATVSYNKTRQTGYVIPPLFEDISFSPATPCPKCPKQHWVSYLKRYLAHCSRSFHVPGKLDTRKTWDTTAIAQDRSGLSLPPTLGKKPWRWSARTPPRTFWLESWRGHLPGCFNAPHFLLTRVPFSTPFPNSLAHTNCSLSPYLCPVGCFREILFKQTRNCHWKPVGFFRHICFLGAGKYLTFYQYRQWNSAKLCIFLVGCHPSDWLLSFEKINSNRIRQVGTQDLALIGQLTGALHFWTVLVPKVSCRQSC